MWVKKNASSLIMLATFIIGIIDEFITRVLNLNIFVVSENYVVAVFTALCTIAALGSAIQSIILGSLDRRIIGIPAKEYFQFVSSTVNVKSVPSLSLITVIVAIFFLSVEFCGAITMLTVGVILVIVRTNVLVWKLLLDESYAERTMLAELKQLNYSGYEKFASDWFYSLQSAVKEKDNSKIDKYIARIRDIVVATADKSNAASIILEQQAGHAFETMYEEYGFVDAYKKVLLLDSGDIIRFNNDRIIRNYISRLQYFSANELEKYNINPTITDIIESLPAKSSEKCRYIMLFFTAVFDNHILPTDTRKKILESIIRTLCQLSWGEDHATQIDVLLYIYKKYVLENEIQDSREDIFWYIIRWLHVYNQGDIHACEDDYIIVLSEMYRALYFYSYKESELLTAEYRHELSSLACYSKTGKDNIIISLSEMVKTNGEHIIKWLSKNAVNFDMWFDKFDYFPDVISCKSSTWTQDSVIRFAFLSYLVLDEYYTCITPIKNYLEDDSYKSGTKELICRTILSFFDPSTAECVLLPTAKAAVEELAHFIDLQYSIDETLLKENYDYFNDKLADINTKESNRNESSLPSDEKLCRALKDEIAQNPHFIKGIKYDPTLDINDGRKITIQPSIEQKKYCNTTSIINRKMAEIKTIIDWSIKNTLPAFSLEFTNNGVKKLLDELSKGEYKYRNYEFVNDWALSSDVRESDDYKSLCEIIHSIPVPVHDDIRQRIFLKTNELRFNIALSMYDLKGMTDEQCNSFLQSYKIADGIYKIDGYKCDYVKAVEYVKNNYLIEYEEYTLVTNLSKDSGFRVEFNRRKKK